MTDDGRRRVVIEGVSPEIDCGRYPVKRVVGEEVVVQADVFCDGHDELAVVLLFREEGVAGWQETPMSPLGNDRWQGSFTVAKPGKYRYTVRAWTDRFRTWQKELQKKFVAGLDLDTDFVIGHSFFADAAEGVTGDDRRRLQEAAERLAGPAEPARKVETCLDPHMSRLVAVAADRSLASGYGELEVSVNREKARFSTWYEFFPRSWSGEKGRHGTFRDCERLLPEVARMGFDVIYLPPIHPIGRSSRKGKNNATTAQAGDPGSPWAIGAAEGGHKAVHPDLGTLEDFERLVAKAALLGIDVALDIAFQCSPDHPYVKEHPEWFLWRPDGTVQYAENPPKKYEDIVPFYFETARWRELWEELKSVVTFWRDRGVRIFRVDNPHTKPFPFWEWLIGEVRRETPDVIFLAEAFTRPKVMYRLAKLGFSQSYTYFTWRTTPEELAEYLTELTRTEVRDFFRPNFWPNTPDILPEHLQYGGRNAFVIRLLLAATLSSNYGIYGPAFELCLSETIPGKEEYIDGEKYEIRHWDWNAPGNLKEIITRVNRVRRENPALQRTDNVVFHETDNDRFLFYTKSSSDGSELLMIVISLDSFHPQSGKVRVPLERIGVSPGRPYLLHDLLSGEKFVWQGEWNRVEIDPRIVPGFIFRIYPRLRREVDFDYFM